MFHYALCLSFHSNTEAVLFARLSSGWAITTGRLLAPRWETALNVFTNKVKIFGSNFWVSRVYSLKNWVVLAQISKIFSYDNPNI